MFTPQGPSLRELTVQALSSVERGYDLLAPKFDDTPFRTPDQVLDAVAEALAPLASFGNGLDLCCGTGAGAGVLRRLCERRVVGVDLSAGMLRVARTSARTSPGEPPADWVRADALALPFGPVFDLAVSFGAFGHFLPEQRPRLFAQVYASLAPGGSFAFPVAAPTRVGSPMYWTLWGFDAVMRVRNALLHPPFVMYYRTFPLPEVRAELERIGFEVSTVPLTDLGLQEDGSPRCRMLLARRPLR